MSDTRLPRLLLVEDEVNLASTLLTRLQSEGYDVTWAKTLAEAAQEVSGRPFDLALLDVGLPDGNGFDLATLIRKKDRSIPIIFVTAFGDPEERIRGLELGAEDYVVKPYHLKELLLRLQNVLKRAKLVSSLPSDPVQIGKAKIKFPSFAAVVDGEVVHLSHKECALLRLLYEKKGEVLSRDEVLNQIWSEDEFPTTRTVDNFILRLRKLVEPNPHEPTIIRSIRGVGYQLTQTSFPETRKP